MRESVSYSNIEYSMKVYEQWECWTLCAIKMKARTGGEEVWHLWPRLPQTIDEGKTSDELSWKVKVRIEKKNVHCSGYAVVLSKISVYAGYAECWLRYRT